MKKTISILLALLMLMSTMVFAEQEVPGLPDNWLMPEVGEYYNSSYLGPEDNSSGMFGDISMVNGFISMTAYPNLKEKEIVANGRYNYRSREQLENAFGNIVYGNGYQFPELPIINYKAGGQTVGEIQYFKDGGVSIVRTDYEKMKGGRMEALSFVELIKTDDSGFTNESLAGGAKAYRLFNYGGGGSDFDFFLSKKPNQDCRYSQVYVGKTVPISEIYDYSIFDMGIGLTLGFDSLFKTNKLNWYDLEHPESVFADVDYDHWARLSINKAFRTGLVKGIGDNKYDPEAVLTKAQVLQMFYNFWSKQKPEEFVNEPINSQNWYDNAINWARRNKIIDENEVLEPNSEASREFASVALKRLIENKEIGLPYWFLVDGFADLKDRNPELIEASKILQKADIMWGFPDGYFYPDRPLTRAQAARIMDGLLYAKIKVDDGSFLPQSGIDY